MNLIIALAGFLALLGLLLPQLRQGHSQESRDPRGEGQVIPERTLKATSPGSNP